MKSYSFFLHLFHSAMRVTIEKSLPQDVFKLFLCLSYYLLLYCFFLFCLFIPQCSSPLRVSYCLFSIKLFLSLSSTISFFLFLNLLYLSFSFSGRVLPFTKVQFSLLSLQSKKQKKLFFSSFTFYILE
jgi:hypothetical protein